jgi:hypothetical protein
MCEISLRRKVLLFAATGAGITLFPGFAQMLLMQIMNSCRYKHLNNFSSNILRRSLVTSTYILLNRSRDQGSNSITGNFYQEEHF